MLAHAEARAPSKLSLADICAARVVSGCPLRTFQVLVAVRQQKSISRSFADPALPVHGQKLFREARREFRALPLPHEARRPNWRVALVNAVSPRLCVDYAVGNLAYRMILRVEGAPKCDAPSHVISKLSMSSNGRRCAHQLTNRVRLSIMRFDICVHAHVIVCVRIGALFRTHRRINFASHLLFRTRAA